MKVTWVLLLALGVVSADVGLGYHYKVPQTSYGVPSYQYGGNSGQYSSSFAGSQGQQNTGYQTSGSGSGFYQTTGSNSGVNVAQPSHHHHSNTGYQTQYESSSQYQSALKKYQNYYQVQQQPAQVFKHFYVHAAPEEQEEVKPRAPIVLPAPQKHYKIIFVKAPSESNGPSVIAPIQPQNEEKTIVYVLVKKPDEQPEVVLPKIEQKPPSKPEVYFIKYKNKEDSQAVINNIVQDYNKDGNSVSVNSGSSDGSSSFSSGHGNVQYNQAAGHTGSSGLGSVQYNQAAGHTGSSGLGSVQYNQASGHTASSGLGSVQYNQVPVQSGLSSGTYTQSFGLGSTSGNSGHGLDSSNIASSIISPVTVSSTASSVSFEGGAISTSQGVPHETYGPPKFRAN